MDHCLKNNGQAPVPSKRIVMDCSKYTYDPWDTNWKDSKYKSACEFLQEIAESCTDVDENGEFANDHFSVRYLAATAWPRNRPHRKDWFSIEDMPAPPTFIFGECESVYGDNDEGNGGEEFTVEYECAAYKWESEGNDLIIFYEVEQV